MDKPVIFSFELPASTLTSRVNRGELRRLARRVYTSEVDEAPERVVQRHWPAIVGGLIPDAVITDRSAPTGGPVDGYLYLAHDGRDRQIGLPGLTVLARRGAGPLAGDAPLPGGLHQASKGRALAENTRPSRARNGRPARTLTMSELGDWVDRLCQVDGEDRLLRYRTDAEELADHVAAPAAKVAELSQLIGVALGTQQVETESGALAARQRRLPYDYDRIRRFDHLISVLRASAPQSRPSPLESPRVRHLPFFEAYFSNFIEGTEFELDEAVAVVYEARELPGRAGDSHDLLGTYRIVADLDEMAVVPSSPQEFLQLLRARHATILAGRPDKNPGRFKEIANRAGGSDFVLPGYVQGTLAAGWERIAELDTAFERAVYIMFLVSEVHPFDDGNGRLARVMMNAELVHRAESRIMVPTVFRDDYLGGLRRLTRQDDAGVLIKALRYVHDYTAGIDFFDVDAAAEQLTRTHAFNEPNSTERLLLPMHPSLADSTGR